MEYLDCSVTMYFREVAHQRISLLGLFAGALLISSAATAQTMPSAIQTPSIARHETPLVSSGGYVGAEDCRSCHKAEYIEFQKTVHAHIKPTKEGEVTGCEMCHGPGKEHSDAQHASHGEIAKTNEGKGHIFSFQGTPQQNWERCVQCHSSSNDQKDFVRSAHARHGVGCNECHATHLVDAVRNPDYKPMENARQTFFNVPQLSEETRWLNSSLLKKNQPNLCAECHANITAQFALPTHHPVPEGAMKCSDCHSTHGTANRAQLRQANWEACVQCHIEKRGPYVFEHPAVKVEGCTACHTPHGSVNKLLLVRREERTLCLSCHVAPQAANVPHGRLSFQARGDCTRCHSVIHGSNFDPNFLH